MVIDGSKKGTSFCVRMWLKKIGKNCLQKGVVRKKLFAEVHKKISLQRKFSHLPSGNNGLSP